MMAMPFHCVAFENVLRSIQEGRRLFKRTQQAVLTYVCAGCCAERRCCTYMTHVCSAIIMQRGLGRSDVLCDERVTESPTSITYRQAGCSRLPGTRGVAGDYVHINRLVGDTVLAAVLLLVVVSVTRWPRWYIGILVYLG